MVDGGQLIHGGWLVRDWGDSRPSSLIEDGALYAENGTIAAVGTHEQLRRRYPRAQLIGDRRCVVVPGMVNAHAHGRGLTTYQMGQPDEPLEMRIVEMAHRSEWGSDASRDGAGGNRGHDPYRDTLYACLKQIAAGITTTVHSHIYLDGPVAPYAERTRQCLRAYRDSGIRCAFALGIRDRFTYTFMDDQEFLDSLPPGVRNSPELRRPRYEMGFAEFHDLLLALAEEFPEITFQLGPWNPVWCTDRLMEDLAAVSARDGWRIHTHLMETRYQAAHARRAHGRSWVARLKDIGMLSPRFSGAHAVWLDDADIEMVHESGAQVVYNPSSNMRLGSGIAPVRALLAAGVPVAFGLDSLGMNDDEDIFQDLRLGQLIQNEPGVDRSPIPAGEMFAMATRAGAMVAGIERIGALVEGNRADAVLLSLPEIAGGFADQPLPDLMIRRAKAAHVRTVVIGGRVLIEDGRWTDQAPAALLDELVANAGAAGRRSPAGVPIVKKAVGDYLKGLEP